MGVDGGGEDGRSCTTITREGGGLLWGPTLPSHDMGGFDLINSKCNGLYGKFNSLLSIFHCSGSHYV